MTDGVMENVESVGYIAILFLILSIFFIILMLCSLLWIGWKLGRQRGALSPYSHQPMQLGIDISESLALAVEEYFYRLNQEENPIFDIRKAALCKSTRRLFPNCVNQFGVVSIDWTFLHKRYPGNYRSWGSLSHTEQAFIRSCHATMEDFQTELSSQNPFPKDIEPYYAMTVPGPLYVDLGSKVLLGWKCVPGTTIEVLVVQLPQPDIYADFYR